MRLMILEDKQLRATFRATSGEVSIGSSAQCGVRLPDPRIGLHHAKLMQDEDGAWWMEVVDFSVPTSLNRTIVKGRAKLRHADEIEVSPFSIRFFIESEKSREELQRERLVELTRRHGQSLPLGTLVQKSDDPVTMRKEQIEQAILLAVRLEQVESVRDLLVPILRALLRGFEGRRAWIGLRPCDTGTYECSLGLTHTGQPCERPAFAEKMETRCLSNTQYLCCPETPAAGLHSAMAAPLVCESGTLGMVYLENDPTDPAYTEADFSAFCALACCVAMPVGNVLRQSAAKRKAVVATQTTIARATQDALTLKALPQWEQLQVAGYRYMGERCCDLYDVVQLRDKTASLIVARLNVDDTLLARHLAEVRTMFRAAALYSEAPHLFARALNWLLYDAETPRAIDLVTGWINPVSGKGQFCVAGAGVRLALAHADGRCDVVSAEGLPGIGRTKAPAYEPHVVQLQDGDTAALATAGIETACNAKGDAFGYAGLEDALGDGLGAVPGHVLSELATDLTEFLSGGQCREDVTVVLAQWRP